MGPTSSVSAAGADSVSAAIAQLFGAHAQAYQAISAQAAQFHEQFVQLMQFKRSLENSVTGVVKLFQENFRSRQFGNYYFGN